MRILKAGFVGVVVGALSVCSADAGVGVAVKVGTLGFGTDLTVGVSERTNVRLMYNTASYDFVRDEDAGEVQTDFDWQSYGALIDWHPAGGGFRISAGLFKNDNVVDLTGDLDDTVNLGGVDFALSALVGQVTFEDVAPYIGFGFGNALDEEGRWHFTCDFGLLFQGEPSVDAAATSSVPSLQFVVDEALAIEVDEIEDDLEFFTIYPVVTVGMSYRF